MRLWARTIPAIIVTIACSAPASVQGNSGMEDLFSTPATPEVDGRQLPDGGLHKANLNTCRTGGR